MNDKRKKIVFLYADNEQSEIKFTKQYHGQITNKKKNIMCVHGWKAPLLGIQTLF